MKINPLVIILGIPFVIMSTTVSCNSEEKMLNHINRVNFSQINGRNYYLLEDEFSCRANTLGKPLLKSWKNRIEFRDGKVLIWETICNDNPIIKKFSPKEFLFSEDFSLLVFQFEKYRFYEEPPELCPEGQWCPIKVNFNQINGRNYYLLEDEFSCRANAPGKPLLKSWKNRIEFRDGKVLIWETICNDNPIRKKFSPKEFLFSEDFSLLVFQFEKYRFYEEPPELCPKGQWCPITDE